MGESLNSKTAAVIGASSGIGLATANLFFDSGARVHALARRGETLRKEAGERLSSGRYAATALDISDQTATEEAVRSIGEKDGLDVLVCAAGVNVPDRSFEGLTPESWRSLLSVNLDGAFHALKAALPYLRASHGTAILVGSVSGMWPDPSGAAYQASKMGLLGLARAVGFEEHARGVRVSALMPGVVDTPILDNRPKPPDPEVREASLNPEDVAETCLFLATLPPRAYVPEMTILPTAIQSLGKTQVPTPEVPEGATWWSSVNNSDGLSGDEI